MKYKVVQPKFTVKDIDRAFGKKIPSKILKRGFVGNYKLTK